MIITTFIVICVLALLIVLGSVIFNVRQIEVYCQNEDYNSVMQTESGNSIRDDVLNLVHDSLYKKSIFLVDDAEITEKVNSLGYVSVINVERKFPNRVYINVYRRFEYAQIKLDEGYALLDENCYVSRIVADRVSPDKIIDITLSGPIKECKVGERISLTSNDADAVSEIINTLSQLKYGYYMASALISQIDLGKKADTIYLETRAGVVIKIMGKNEIAEKLRMAVSLYSYDSTKRYTGQITVYEAQDVIKASYSEDSDYYA